MSSMKTSSGEHRCWPKYVAAAISPAAGIDIHSWSLLKNGPPDHGGWFG